MHKHDNLCPRSGTITDNTTDTSINVQCQVRCRSPERRNVATGSRMFVVTTHHWHWPHEINQAQGLASMEEPVLTEGGGNLVDGTKKGCYKHVEKKSSEQHTVVACQETGWPKFLQKLCTCVELSAAFPLVLNPRDCLVSHIGKNITYHTLSNLVEWKFKKKIWLRRAFTGPDHTKRLKKSYIYIYI